MNGKFNDGYYDPPDEGEEPCQICHYESGNCTCPECTVCGDVGNPACINKHMSFDQFPHFRFQLSKAELEAERQEEEERAKLEAEMDEWAEGFRELEAELMAEPKCWHEGYEGKSVCGHCGQRLE